MKKLNLLSMVMMMLFTTATFSQTKTWTGAFSNAWNTAGNWNPSGVPNSTHNVFIPSAPANQPVISGTTTPVCNNLTVYSGALLTISGTSTANAQLNVSGTATFNGNLSIGGSIGRTGKLIATNIVWNSTSSVSGFFGGRVELSGNWTFASGSSVDMGFCFVTFNGTSSSYIFSYSANSKFGSVTFGKTTTATTYIGTGSNATLTFGSGVSINADNTFTAGVNITTIVQGNIVANGRLNFYNGTMQLERASGTQSIQLAGTNNRVNNLVINCGGTVTLNNQLDIQGDLTIQSGTFDPQNNTLYVSGDWNNEAGPEYFTEGTGRVVMQVIINKGEKGSFDQYINYTENFNILEINNAYGDVIINSSSAVVTCNQYDWTNGGIKVQAGTFTANDLVDNGIFGYWGLQTGGTINLTKVSGYVDLNNANLNITGGTFNVYGGTTDSYWPFGGASSITMSGGVLNFAQTGIRVQPSPALTYNITGGTIKTARSFTSYKANFNPTGGTVELYGPTDASLYLVSGSTLYSVDINKGASAKEPGDDLRGIVMIDRETGKPIEDEGSRAQTVNLTNPATFNGNFVLSAGTFNSNSHTIQAKRDWTNNAGAGSFNPGTGRVIFNGGNYHQYCYNETFNILEVAKASGGAFRLSSGTSVTCAVYDWTAGSIDVLTNGGTFTALDLFDNGIFGGYFVNPGGTINLYQGASKWIDLSGNITFTGGGTINVYGGSSTSYWPYNNNASITMNAGVLDFKNHGIFVTTSAHSLTTSITGGTILTAGTFACNRTDFNPTGGTIELYGNQNANLSMTAGSLYNLSINKPVANNVSLTSNATLTGGLTVNGGTLNMNGKTLATGTESAVNNGGTLHLNAGSALLISGTWWIKINEGGLIKVIGEAGNPAMISRNGAFDYIYLNVQNGGTISARNAWFHYTNPVIISPGGIIDPDNPFDDCQFRYAADGLLWVENQQTLLMKNVEFLTPAAGYNVRKSANNGELTFKDATGNYAGEAYENDPYNRIHWTATQPGLWTGAVSTNWHTAGNWDDGVVPTSTVDVIIPASVPHMPVISTHANCKNLTLNGTLIINDPTLTVSGSATIAGHLTLNFELARFVVMGDLTWQSGSTASQNDIDTEIQVYGNFTFDAGSNVQLNNGGVRFRGTVNKSIINHSTNSWFYNLVSHKTSAAAIDFSDASSEPLRVTGSLSTEPGAKFTASSGLNIELHHDLVSSGTFELNWPRLVFSGVDQYIKPNVNDYFYTIDFNQSGTVTINTSNSDVLNIRGGVRILSGVFNPGSSTVKVQSGWANEVGPGGFIAGNSRVIFEGFLISDIYNNENFNILEINKSAGNVMVNGATVTCNSFDWTNGQLRVSNGGVFTAYDLADDGIFADIELQSGSTVNLYQDSYQRVDLGGKLWIMGGSTVNVFGGNGWSQWPYGADATLYITEGTLDFKDQGINVNFMSPNTLTLDLTGGVIRTPVGFFCNRPDFDPEPSTLEIYGPGNSSIDMQSGLLWDVNINKTGAEDEVLINSNLTANSVIVNSGVLKSTPNSILIFKNAYAYGNGTIWLTEGTDIKLKGSHEFAANGGKFMFMGEPDNYVSVGRHGTNYVNLYVGNGGIVSARYAHFSHLLNGLFVMNTGIVDADNTFTGCSFENGGYYQFRIENNQDLTIQDAHFPTASAPYNAGKLSNQGSVTFFNATGDFAGEAFEDDPYNRIHWIIPVPGLWTGAVSTDWHTAGNWSDGNVPTDDINVEIPADRMFMPVISGAQAFCHNLEVFGTLTINNNSLQVGGNADFHGTLAMNDWQAFLTVHENMNWRSGSAANITANANIRVYGNWSFLEGSQAQIENGAVLFAGTTPSTILCNSDESWFNHVEIEKSAMNYTYFSESSLFPLRTNNLYVFATAGFASEGEQDIIVRGNVGSYGVMSMEGGSLILTGINPIIAQNTGDYFHNLHFGQTGTATINTVNTNVVNIKNDLVIISGIFEAGSSVIYVSGDWDNQAGGAAFDKGTSRVVFNGTKTQFCSSENFHILEVDNSVDLLYNQAYSTITCDIYDWTQGGLWISPGNFSAAALADDGLFGTFAIFGGTMELHQDVSKSVDLIGEIIIGNNATLNVYGGNGMSNWGESGDASVTMGYSTGVLDFKNSGINIVDQAPFQFTGNITAGTIKTTGSFYAVSPGFNPTGGTVELYGEQGATVLTEPGSSFWNLLINKPVTFNPRVSMYSTKVTNELIVQQGLCELFSTYTFEIGNIIVQDDGWLANNGAIVKMSNLVVNSGGYLTNEGFEEVICTYTNLNPGEKYSFTLESGSYMLVYGTLFENMDENGIYISAGAIITEYEAFKNCEFRNGAPGPYPLLTIQNDQDLIIENAVFPANTWAGQYNVRKTVTAGSVTFINPTGDFAGEAYEDDPHNRIHWVTFVPGLWTGAVSTDWFTADNWSDGNVPTEETNVLIPADRMFMPVISSGTAYCNDLTLNGTLTLGGANLDIKGNLEVNGHFETTLGGEINIGGDVEWNQGSTASIHLFTTFYAYGNWLFNAGADVQITGGTVFLLGDATKTLINHSPESQFNSLFIYKSGGAFLEIPGESDQPIHLNGVLRINVGSQLIVNSDQELSIGAHFYNDGNLHCNFGTIRFTGFNINISCSPDDIFNNVIFDHTGTATLMENFSEFNVHGDLTFNSGVFNPGDNTIKLWGSWINNAGPGAFNKAQSRVIFTGTNGQFCSSEDFNILEIDKSLQYLYLQNEDVVTCNSYDWTNGGLWIAGNATFIANDLADNGIYGLLHLFDGYVELHQDDQQSVDLRGELIVSGGEMKVFGGNDISRWGMYADGHLTMSGGVLDFGEIDINVAEDFGFNFSSNITGGVIRTMGTFWAQSDSFSPTGGVVELYGNLNATVLTELGGSFWDLYINKPEDFTSRVSMYSATVANNLVVEKGLCEFYPTYTFEIGNIIVQDGGWLANGGATVHMSGLVVNAGGELSSQGYDDIRSVYTSLNPGEKYSFTVESGGNIYVDNTLFEHMDENGIYIAAGATVNNYLPFINSEFRNGAAGPYPLLVIDTDQDLIIENAVFPINTWGGQYNVRKSVDQGSVTFVNYSGDFGGSAFEDDPYNRINWQSFVPGLWTGLVSSDWNTPGNWGNMQVPDEFTDVTIPADAPNMPVVNSPDAICYSITIDAGADLTIGSGKLFVNNTLIIFGNLTMTNPASEIDAFKLSWESGSTENVTAGEIKVKWWYFREGTLAKLGAGNTVTVTQGIVVNDLEAEFGSLVISTFGKSHEQRALYTLRVSGDCLIKTGSNWNTNMDIIIAGNFTIEMGSGWTAFENDVAITVGGNLNLGGHLRNFSEITVNGNFELAEFGELNLSGGTFTCNYETEDWIELNGKLIMTNLPGVIFKHSNVRIGETFDSEWMLSGIFRVGKSFEATHPNSFHPGGVEIHFTNTNSGHTLNVSNGNYLSSMYITKYGGELTLANHLIIEGDHVNLNAGNLITAGFDMTLKGGIFIRDNSRLIMSPGSVLDLGGELMLRDGGTLETVGLADNYNTINSNITISNPSYNGNINSFLNGKISAAYTHFTLNNKPNGILVESTGLVDPTNSFHYCSFSSETMATTLLTIDNSQDIVINTAHFPDFLHSGFNAAKLTNGGSVTFNNATGNFAGSLYENDPFNRIHWETTLFSQSISIPAGWSGISSYILPSQPAMEDVFAPIADELIIAQTMTQMYYPGQNINQIGNWESHSAYKVKTNAACMLNIEGELETNLAVSLNAGWNLLPVVTPDGSDPVNLFMPVNGFAIVKDVAGTGVFWPQYNINSIGYIFPGKAYYVLMTAPGVVDYTGMKSATSGTLTVPHVRDETLSGLGYNIQPTPSTHTIAILPEALKGFDQGTIIGACDQAGNCFGVTVYNSEFISLTVFGDDPTTAVKDGFFEGEMIYFKTLTGLDETLTGFETLSGLIPTFDQNLPQYDGLFTENGLSAITGLEAATGIDFDGFGSMISVYPNPSEGLVNISGLIDGAKINITDIQGQLILAAVAESSDLFTLDLTVRNAGVYFVHIQYNGHHIFRKIVLR